MYTLGMIMTTTDILNLVLVIFVGYIGQRAHKPRAISVSFGLIAIALIFCFGGPYFYFKNITPGGGMENNTLSVGPREVYLK